MPSFLHERKFFYPFYGIIILTTITLIYIGLHYQWIALFGAIIVILLTVWTLILERKARKEREQYISTLSHRIKKAGEDVLAEVPVGILLINDDFYIEWCNSFINECFKENTLIGRPLYELNEELMTSLQQGKEISQVTIHDRHYEVIYKSEEKLLYFFDITDQVQLQKKYEEEQTVISYILLDNYDDVTRGMNDQARGELNILITSLLNQWAQKYGIYLKRVSSDRFVSVFNIKTFQKLEKNKFSILDVVREKTAEQDVAITLSIGIGMGAKTYTELGMLAQSSLDLALGRGGDQVAIKLPNGKLRFYGGKTNPMEKRTRVRARVISHALKDLILESDQVIVMGHKYPDMDAIGASVGVCKAAELNTKKGFIVIDMDDIDTSVKRLVEAMKESPRLYQRFISKEEALDIITEDTLLVVVDTHKPSFVIEEKLLQKTDRIVVIDHHRRSEEFIDTSLLVYIEPYASSTAELVTELLEYQPKNDKLTPIEATALLSGIIVDTKNFTLRTGSRTFDAASYLRTHGADTVKVQKFLKEDINNYVKRSKLIETTEIYRDGIAIASGKDDEIYNQVMIAQAADLLLTMDGVSASFVISRLSDEIVGISARSLGDINVQILMEALGGGGHLTNAAVQLKGDNVVEAELKLKQIIDEYFEGSESS